MLSYQTVALALLFINASVNALPIRREVPQEHSHESILSSVSVSLQLNNPDQITDAVFGLLGNAAAAAGQGKITDTDCLQQATADQAFTNAKTAGDVDGQVNALIYRALERNTGKVGLASVQCTSLEAVNPEIAAIQQHQDPASAGAAAINKAIVLTLAQQIHAVGGDPQDALKSGTFAPGDLNDNTGKGNTCDDANDAEGCIFSQGLIVDDATADEINAAVGGAAVSIPTSAATSAAAAATSAASGKGANNAGSATSSSAAGSTATSAAAASGANLQPFTGALGGQAAPPVTAGGRGFVVDGSDFLNIGAALGRSCDVQHNACANVANSAAGRSSGVSVEQCDTQNTQCRAA